LTNRENFVYDSFENFPPETNYEKTELAKVQRDNKWGLINKDGEEATPCIFDFIDNFQYGSVNRTIAFVKQNGKDGIIDNEGKEVEPCIYKKIELANSASFLLWIETEKGIGIYNFVLFKKILDCEYESIIIFRGDGVFAVKYNGLWGFFNRDGKVVTDFCYNELDTVQSLYGRFKGYKDNKWELIDTKTGLPLTKKPYEIIEIIEKSFGHYKVFENGKWGLIDSNGQEVLQCLYDYEEIELVNDGFSFKINKKIQNDEHENHSNQTETLKTINMDINPTTERPNFLTVLCVVTILSIGISILLKLIVLFGLSPSLSNLEEQANAIIQPNWEMPISISIIILLIEIWAVIQMWNLKKMGFTFLHLS
jgi:hypothetical protein